MTDEWQSFPMTELGAKVGPEFDEALSRVGPAVLDSGKWFCWNGHIYPADFEPATCPIDGGALFRGCASWPRAGHIVDGIIVFADEESEA